MAFYWKIKFVYLCTLVDTEGREIQTPDCKQKHSFFTVEKITVTWHFRLFIEIEPKFVAAVIFVNW